jgi:hypothetical protein
MDQSVRLTRRPRLTMSLLRLALGLFAALTASLLATFVSPQLALALVIVAVVVAALPADTWLDVAVYFGMFSGLVRRLVAGDSGRVDADPLIMVPFVLAAAALAVPVSAGKLPRKIRVLPLLVVALCGVIAVSALLGGAFGAAYLYVLVTQFIPFLIIAGVLMGLLPDVFPRIARYYPFAILISAVYGIFQFLFLPEWDRVWMIESGLTSIGHPFPLEVRVFGVSDSPGPYSVYISVGILITVQRLLTATGVARLRWMGATLVLFLPLVLTGVRTALFGVVICLGLIAFRSYRGVARLRIVALIPVLMLMVVFAVNRFGGNSTILTSDRLTNLNLGSDYSVQARLALLRQAGAALRRPFGTPSELRADNFLLDVLFTYGPVAAVLAGVISVVIAFRAWQHLSELRTGRVAPIIALFLLLFLVGGNLFVSSLGVLMALILASAAVTHAVPGILPRRNHAPAWKTPRSPQATSHTSLRTSCGGQGSVE